MNANIRALGRKVVGGVQAIGMKMKQSGINNIQQLGAKMKDAANVGLRKTINTLADIGQVGDKALPYLYGVAHAAGVGEAALPIMVGAQKLLHNVAEKRDYLQGVRRSIMN